MFTFQYHILDESKNEIMNGDNNYFEDFDGQIELHFNNSQYGHIYPSISSYNELMLWWFKILNTVAIKLIENDYVAFYVPDIIIWMQIFKKGDYCIINEVEPDENSLSNKLITTNKLYNYREITQGEQISVKEFVSEINKKTKSFIKELIDINPKVEQSEQLEDIIKLNHKLQGLI